MEIPKQLKDEIWDYCRVNNITNIDDFMVKLIRQGFTMEKYGSTPVIPNKTQKQVTEAPIEPVIEEVPQKVKPKPVKKVDNKKQDNKTDLYGE